MLYRVLLILPVLYRKWASLRLQDLAPWISKWELDQLFTISVGADEAWYTMAVKVELSRLEQTALIGGSADLQKAFDEIQWGLLYKLLEIGGFPKGILDAYKRFQESLAVHNTIGSHLGVPHFRKCSIPQWCPMSMVFIAFMLMPWALLMLAKGAEPRVLADDILTYTEGEKAMSTFKNAFATTLRFLRDMGARVAPKKSHLSRR